MVFLHFGLLFSHFVDCFWLFGAYGEFYRCIFAALMNTLSSYNIYIIGAGNVATQLGLAMARNGFCIRGVWARQKQSRADFSAALNGEMVEVRDTFEQDGNSMLSACSCVAFDDLESLVKEASKHMSLVFFCVSDDAIQLLAQQFACDAQHVCCVHTAGSVPMRVFEGLVSHFGVIYPLQTLSKGRKVDFSQVPLFVEGSDEATELLLDDIARRLSQNVQKLDSQKRKNLHLSAVFACNFPNALFGIAEQLLADAGVERRMLEPLIKETVEKFFANGAKCSQTGPAVRGDNQVMARHVEMLAEDIEKQEVYKAISNYIRNQRISDNGQ